MKNKIKLDSKLKDLLEYLSKDYKKDLEQDVAVMVHKTDEDICCFAHSDKGIKTKNILLAGILTKVISNLLIDEGFTDSDTFGTAIAMLEAYNCPIEKFTDLKKIMEEI